jgi:hypothetical protein
MPVSGKRTNDAMNGERNRAVSVTAGRVMYLQEPCGEAERRRIVV